MALRKVQSGVIADNAITSDKIAAGAVTASDIAAGAVTPPTPTAVSDQANTSTGYFDVPAGTTAQRPASPATGMIRFNTTIGKLEQYDGTDWVAIDAPPVVTGVSPSTELGSDDPQVIVINGSSFSSIVTVKLIGDNLTEYTPTTVTRNSSAQITITFVGNDRITGTNDPYDIKVTNSSGLSTTLENALNINDAPTWVTTSGSLGTVIEDVTMSNITLSATDPESVGLTYTIASGALPSGVSLSSGGIISGTPNVNDSYNSSGVTHNFTVGASDGAQTINRSFSILRKWLDGTSSTLAAPSASFIKSLTGTTSDGKYWIKAPSGTNTAFQTYCIMSRDGGGWMKALQFYNATSMATTNSVNLNSTWIDYEINLAAGKIATSDWNALNTTQSFLFRITKAASYGAHRYWRYRVGAATISHHPRFGRLMMSDINGNNYTIYTVAADNCSDNGTVPNDGNAWSYDFGSAKSIISAGMYSVYGGGARGATVYVDYSDDNSNWTNAFSGNMQTNKCGVVTIGNAVKSSDNLLGSCSATGKFALTSGSLTEYGTDLDPTMGYSQSLDMESNGSYDYVANFTNDGQARCNHTTNYWISDHNYNYTWVTAQPPSSDARQCWTFGTDRFVTNLHWMSGNVVTSGGSINWGDGTDSSFALFIK